MWNEKTVMFIGQNIRKFPYGLSCHVDTIKLRLLTPYGVQSLKNDPTFKNPAIGKASALTKMLSWNPFPAMALSAKRRFGVMMAPFIIHRDPMVFLPSSVGGHGIPHEINTDDLMDLITAHVPINLVILIYRSATDGSLELWVDYLFRRMSTGGVVRGLIDPMMFSIIEQYAQLQRDMRGSSRTFSQMHEEYCSRYPDIPEESVRYSDIRRFIKKSGLIPVNEIANNLDRATLIRYGFLSAMGRIPIDDLVVSRDQNLKSPTQVFNQFVELEARHYPKEVLSSLLDTSKGDEALLWMKTWISGGCRQFQRRGDGSYVPSSLVKDSLNGMRLSIPFVAPLTYTKGSVADPDLVTDNPGYVGQALSLKRIK